MPNSVQIPVPTTPPSPLPHSRLARSHNRRFHVRFPGVDSEEHLINYYSCALVADILLQGHLYITEKYFAFYSNIFGRKTQILIPISDVIKVTKERTAKIIPNAVGLYTEEGKYVFGSLLSRNTTYRLMHHVWLKSADPDTTEDEPSPSEPSEPATSDELPPGGVVVARPDDLPRRLSRRKSDIFPRISAAGAARRQCAAAAAATSVAAAAVVDQITLSKCRWDCTKTRECFTTRIEENVQGVKHNEMSTTTHILLAATVLLVVLFLLATVLVYRVSIVHSKNGIEDNWPAKNPHRLANYLELLRQQQEAVEEEILHITNTLKNRLNDLGEVRQSIDQISILTKKSFCQGTVAENADDSMVDVHSTS